MRDVWDGLPVLAQDVLVLLAILLPILLVGWAVLRGFAPWPLIGALARRFRLQVVLFLLLIAGSVGAGIGLSAVERGLRQGTAQAADPFDLVVGAKGSEITLLMATVFLQPSDVSLLDGEAYARVAGTEGVAMAAPLAFGDSAEGFPVVGTTAGFVTHLGGEAGLTEGGMWSRHDEAVVGANVPFAIGGRVSVAHGAGDAAQEDAHGDLGYRVTGRLAPTGSPWDSAVIVPVEAVWQAHGLATGHAPGDGDRLGPPFDPAYFPGTPAIVVEAASLPATYGLRNSFDTAPDTMAFFPATVLSRLYGIMGDARQIVSILTLVSQAMVAAAVLVGFALMTRLIRRQMAVLRALGAPARFVFAVVWGLSVSLFAAGAVLGLGVGLALAAALSGYVGAEAGIDLAVSVRWAELHLAAAFATLASLVALLPAAAMQRADLVESLRG